MCQRKILKTKRRSCVKLTSLFVRKTPESAKIILDNSRCLEQHLQLFAILLEASSPFESYTAVHSPYNEPFLYRSQSGLSMTNDEIGQYRKYSVNRSCTLLAPTSARRSARTLSHRTVNRRRSRCRDRSIASSCGRCSHFRGF